MIQWTRNVLVDIYLHGMAEEYRVFLENSSLSSFSKLWKQHDAPMNQFTSLIKAADLARLPQADQHQRKG